MSASRNCTASIIRVAELRAVQRVLGPLLLLCGVLVPASCATAPSQSAPAQAAGPSAPSVAANGSQAVAASDPRLQIISKLPGTRLEDLQPSPIPGMYELTRGAKIAYVTSDGRYAISGDLIDIAADHNLSEIHRRELRARLINGVPESDMIVFGAADAPYTVNVFTDVDCAYCRELHRQIADYNRLGIRIRYLSYPRTGPNTESWRKAEEVWCANNRNQALTAAKQNAPVDSKICPDNPVAREYALGRDLRIDGTPALVTSSGELLPGYMAPLDLAKHLRQVN